MTKTELFELINNGENSGIEFKQDILDNRSLAKELVAFTNLQGGQVLLGVADDGTITGLTRDRLEEWVMNACRDKIRPEIIPYFEVLKDVEPGKNVAVVTVERGWSVHCVWHDNHRTYYIRVGSESREAGPEELERLFQQRGAFRLETRPVSGSSIRDVDLHRIRQWFQQTVGQSIVLPADENVEDWQKLLINTEFLFQENDRIPATVASILLFSQNPNKFLPQAGVDAVAYPGNEKDYAARERLAIRGPLTPLFGTNKLIENGIVEQVIEFVKRNTITTADLLDGARRVEHWTYPEEAVREAVVNALVHRDYLLSGTDIELSIYTNRLEIISPGRLPNGITPERMIVGCRAARNQLLKDVMRDYGYLEHMGMGVPRKIVRKMLEHNGTMPEFIEDGERFTVRLLNNLD
jgi:ATP-dependent DNA helicase RecG